MITSWTTTGCSAWATCRCSSGVTAWLAIGLEVVVAVGLAWLATMRLGWAAVVVMVTMLLAMVAVVLVGWRTRSVVTVAVTHGWHVDAHIYILGLAIYHCVSVVSHCSAKCHHREHKAQNHHLLHSC